MPREGEEAADADGGLDGIGHEDVRGGSRGLRDGGESDTGRGRERGGGSKVGVGKAEELVVDGAADYDVGMGEGVVLADELLHVGEGEVAEVVGKGVGAQRMVGTIEQLVVLVAGQIAGFLEIGFELCGAAAEVGLEELGGDEGSLEHLGYDGQELRGKAAEEVERDVAGADIGRPLDDDAVEVEELRHLVGRELCGGFAEELVGSMGLAFAGLVGTAGLEGDVELEEADGIVAEKVEGVAVGQGMGGGDEGCGGGGFEHGDGCVVVDDWCWDC